MTNVKAKILNDKLFSIEIDGHSNFSNYGNDVVCAGISAIVFGSLNALSYYNLNDSRIIISESFIKINLVDDLKIQTVAQTLLIQLQTVEQSYPDYIKIEII